MFKLWLCEKIGKKAHKQSTCKIIILLSSSKLNKVTSSEIVNVEVQFSPQVSKELSHVKTSISSDKSNSPGI